MKNSQNKWLIHFSGDDYWNSNTAVRHHICRALHDAGYKILWVNPIGFRMPSLKKKGTGGKVWRKVQSLLKLLRRESPGWYVITPFQLPLFKKSRLNHLNRGVLNAQLFFCRILLRIHHPTVLYTTPTFANTLGRSGFGRCVYYYSDQYTLHRELSDAERRWMEDMDRRLQIAADAVICCSRKIYENVAKQVPAEKLFYFPHRVDFRKFNEADHSAIPPDLLEIPKPRIGYYGTLSDSNDWKIIQYCAEKRPDYQFVFVGRKDIADAGVEHLPNIHFLGKKPFEIIQNYGAGFDVAIMFWVRREWIKHCSPLKLKEYLSLGIPVVSTLIEEVEKDYADIVYSAETPEEFLAALDAALTQDNSERVRKGLSRVSGDAWSDIIPIMEGV
jgi:glycosyltransferase involved in cell wall biosynthesis